MHELGCYRVAARSVVALGVFLGVFLGVVLGAALTFASNNLSAATSEAASAIPAEPAASVSPPVTVLALWKPQEFTFHYQSFTTFYSCTSLAEKVHHILVKLGADPRSKVRVSGCDSIGGIARAPLLRISMSAPVEATPQALAELEKTRPQRELAARLRNDRARGVEPEEQFAAQWRRVSMSRGSLGLAPGDCELVEQLQRQVLPRLSVRIIESKLRCLPHQSDFNQPRLEVEALKQLPKPDTAGGGGADRRRSRP